MKINSPFVAAGLGNQGIRLTLAFVVVSWLVNASVVHWICVGYAVVGWDTELQAGRSRFRFPMGVIGIFHWLNPSGPGGIWTDISKSLEIWFHTEAEETDSDVAALYAAVW